MTFAQQADTPSTKLSGKKTQLKDDVLPRSWVWRIRFHGATQIVRC